MKRSLLIYTMTICLALAIICLQRSTSAQAAELKKLTLDDASALGTTISTDSTVKSEGKGAIRVSTLWPTTICLGEISGRHMENARLLYQAKVRCENLQGAAFLEMWCHADGGQYFSRGIDSVVTGTMNWKTLQTPFVLREGEKAEKVTLNLVINGRGTIWIDDLRLLKEPLK